MSIGTLQIRAVTEDEVGVFQRILYSLLEELHPNHPQALAAYRQQFTEARIGTDLQAGRGAYLLSEFGGVSCGVGVGYNRGEIAFLNWIGVVPEFRKRGIGRTLLQTLHRQFRDWGCRKSELFTYQQSPYLKEFYKNEGYTVLAELPDHYYGLDITYMVCDL
jgi:GNAT superfamily N-acetyltransferase